jgi:hypothetical protein
LSAEDLEGPEGGAAPEAAEPAAPERAAGPVAGEAASSLRVVTLAGLLLVLLGSWALLLRPGDGSIEPSVLLEELFEAVEDPLPGSLNPVEARRLPTGERYVRLEAAAPVGAGPSEVTVVEFPAVRGEQVLKEQILNLSFRSPEEGGGGRPGMGGGGGWGSSGSRRSWGKKPRSTARLQEKGTFRWNGFEAQFARLLHGAKAGDAAAATGGPSYETVRVNLSTGGRCVLAYLRYPEDASPSREEVAATVAAFHPAE